MSNYLYNSYRFSAANSARVDVAGQNRGQITLDGKFGFDCSGFLWYALKNSGYDVGDGFSTSSIMASKGQLSTAGQQWQTSVAAADVKSGDLVWFNGHAGLVVSFDATTGKGVFRSSTGSNNSGRGVMDAEFSTSPVAGISCGKDKAFFGFTRVNEDTYRQGADVWQGTDTTKFPSLEPAPILSNLGLASTVYQAGWFTQMATWESNGAKNKGYDAFNVSGGGQGAFGKYQMRQLALKSVGLMDEQGNWVGTSKEDFLKNPAMQEKAARDYAAVLENELSNRDAWNRFLGKMIDGRLITEEGLMSIAWKWGATGALNELEAADKPGGKLRAETGARLDNFRGTNPPSGDGADGVVSGATVQVPTVSNAPDMPVEARTSGFVTHHTDGSTTYEYEAKADSADGAIKKGDLISTSYNKAPSPSTESNFSILTIWKVDGSVETRERSDDGTQETWIQWSKDGKKLNQITTEVGGSTPGRVFGEFIKDGQNYNSDGTPKQPTGSGLVDPIDPATIMSTPPGIISQNDAKQYAEAHFAGRSYGLGERDTSKLPSTALCFVPTGSVTQIIDDLTAQGFSVEQTENAVFAQKDDEYFIISDGVVEMGKGARYGRIDVVNSSLVISDTDAGTNTRYVLSEIAGKSVLVKGAIAAVSADDVEPDMTTFRADRVVAIGGQTMDTLGTGTYGLNADDYLSYGLTFNNFINGTVPKTGIDLVAGRDPATMAANNWAPPEVTVTNLPGNLTQRTIELGNGTTLSSIRNEDRLLISTAETEYLGGGQSIIKTYDAQHVLQSSKEVTVFDDNGLQSRTETITSAINGSVVRNAYDTAGALYSSTPVSSGANNLARNVGTTLDFLSLIKAIQSGQPLPLVASGLRVANDLSNLSGAANLPLSGASNVASGILSLLSLDAALERGDTLGAVTAGAQAVTFGATAYANFAGVSATETSSAIAQQFGASSALTGLEEAVPYLNLVNSIANGDMTGTAVSVLSMMGVPYIGWAYAAYSIISSLFAEQPEIPDPWGNGGFVWDGNGISTQVAGETGGMQAVSNVMNNVLATLNALIERERQQNPGSALGIIPNRMPGVSLDLSGYRYTDINSLSGAEKHPALRFDTSGKPYNAQPGSPESFQSIVEGIARSALARGALAPLWEVQTAKLQTDAGDPKAGLREEERAGRAGQLAAPLACLPGTTQAFRPVMLDLDGDGIETTDRAHGVAFDVDDSGYLKQTAWLKGDDGFLVLDRNLNGQIDSGKELFNNATVDLSRRGLGGMAWLDANYDGRLSAVDPVWNELKVWQDSNQNGVQEATETHTLSSLGITELNYAMGTFTQNGIQKQLASPGLQADKDGSKVTVVPEGILVQASADGHLSLLVTRVDDRTALQANRDGITGFEDIEAIVSGADLLVNDTLGGFAGRNLRVTGVGNFRHGTGFMDGNGFVHFSPTANYSGTEAGFDYGVRAVNGQLGTATVDVNVQNVNDAPVLANVEHRYRPIYGSSAPSYDESGNTFPGGLIYTPTTVADYYDEYGTFVAGYTTPIKGYEDTGAGRVVGADVDDAAASLSYALVSQPQYGGVSLNADGTFQYISWKQPGVASDRIVTVDGQYASAEGYYGSNLPAGGVNPTTDVFQVQITDPHGASTVQSISVPHIGPYLASVPAPGGGGGKKPIAIDLGGDGFQFTKVDDSNIFFDINGDGRKHRTAWIGKDDGLLAYDIDGDGKIDKAGEISFARYKDGAQTDLEGLKAFDSNGDGIFGALDEKWAKFGIWQDKNQNGITDAGEFRTLTEMGIAAVGLTSDGRFQVINGQTVHGVGAVNMTDGRQLAMADVTLAYSNEIQLPLATSGVATVAVAPFSPSGEELNGTAAMDLILGKNGNNIVHGYAGDDVISEGGGNDIIDGGDGDDLIYSGADNDLVMGANGDDTIYAGLGSDVVFGGDGNDAIFAEGGNDVVFGGNGNDLIAGGAGNDVLSGDAGDDQVYGESGNDALFGRDGNDQLFGMDGADRLAGGTGNDLLDGGAGPTTCAAVRVTTSMCLMTGRTGWQSWPVKALIPCVPNSTAMCWLPMLKIWCWAVRLICPAPAMNWTTGSAATAATTPWRAARAMMCSTAALALTR